MGCAHSKTPQELEAEAALAAATEFVDAKLAGDGGSWILGFVERLRGEESEDMSEKARDFLIQSRLQ
jgi:N-glycosylase/DNA lyase